MSATGTIGGHDVTWDGHTWRYDDDGAEAPDGRPCPHCHHSPSACGSCGEPHDPCIGHVDGARSVCCGHGRFEGFVLWPGVAAGCKVPSADQSLATEEGDR